MTLRELLVKEIKRLLVESGFPGYGVSDTASDETLVLMVSELAYDLGTQRATVEKDNTTPPVAEL